MAYRDPREPFIRLTAAEAKRILENGGAQLVDVRETWEYQNGHIPDSEHIPVNVVFPRRSELNADRDIIFVCSVGQRSALACEMAAAAGLTRLYNLEGGTEAWVKEGFPFVKK
jgi:rhodanese-related sulfurtransferase